MHDKASVLKEAQKHLSKGAFDKAISELEKFVKDSPDGYIQNMIGDLYLKKGSQKNAVESYFKAAVFFRQVGFSQKALALYKKILNINPSHAGSLCSFGELSEEKGLVTDAIKYYLAAADILLREGKTDKILAIYQKILSLSPSNIPLRIKVADIFLKEGLKADASKEYLFVAEIYDEKADFPKAKEFYQKSIDLQPTNREAVLNLNRLYEKTGETLQAVEQMREAIAFFPEDKDMLYRCSDVSLLADDTALAKQCLLRIQEQAPEETKARRLLGELYLAEGSAEKAWEEFFPMLDSVLLEKTYDDAVRFLEQFRSVDPMGTGKRLVSLFKQFQETGRVIEELVSLGDICRGKGMLADSTAYYREAYELDPENLSLRDLLAASEAARKSNMSGITEPEMEEPPVMSSVPGAGEGSEAAPVSGEGEKTFDELLTEADAFSRYGLLIEAQKLLERLKQASPENVDVHQRLKSIYTETGDKEAAVTECLILSELYKRKGDVQRSIDMLDDAGGIYPDDPRLNERGLPTFSRTPADIEEQAGFVEFITEKEPVIDDYEEEISEADFYMRQGLATEALKILEKLHAMFPQHEGIRERLESLGQSTSVPEAGETAETFDLPESTMIGGGFEPPEAAETRPVLEQGERPASGKGKSLPDEPAAPSSEPDRKEYEELSFSDLVEAQEMPEPALDSEVHEIFQEFKKGIEKELGDEDSETHYNLGIAYKEMGLIDDAIKEFQTAKNDPKRLIQSASMLGVCYMEKGFYSLAIDVIGKAIDGMKDKDDAYWAMKFDLGRAHEKNKNKKKALDLYTEVYGWDAKFRDVSDKISRLRAEMPNDAETQKDKPKERKNRVSYL
jgi:tetratricopeptide (TPR) repeat protein